PRHAVRPRRIRAALHLGKRRRSRGARHPILAARNALARAVARGDARRGARPPLRAVAAERYLAGGRLHLVTGPVGTTGLVDLHMHSTASDGSRSPADVVRAAKRAELVAIALTDHDTVAGLAEARAAGEELGVRIINGVELSAVEGESETHLLGLHLSDT